MRCQIAEVISADGVRIRYEVCGSGDPTLILVHGWGGNRKVWQPHSETLARSHRVVAMDLAGFGESGTERSAWTMQAFGEDVVAVMQDLPTQKAVLVGHSLGGAAVLEAARLESKRVAGVVLVDIFHDPDARDADTSGEQMIGWMRSVWGNPAKIRSAMFSPETPESIIRRCISEALQTPLEHHWAIIRSFVRWKNSNLTEVLARLGVPVEAINSEPPLTNVDAFRRYMPGFRAATIPGAGHGGIVMERVEQFDRLLLDAARRFSQIASA